MNGEKLAGHYLQMNRWSFKNHQNKFKTCREKLAIVLEELGE
jgi:hypothetical protein